MPRIALVLLPLALFAAAEAAPWRVKSRIVRAERDSNGFRRTFERELNDYGWTKLKGAAAAKSHVQRLDRALESLRIEADDRKPMRGRDRMIQVVSRARAVDAAFRANPEFAGTTRPKWARLRTQIDALARTYELKPVTRR